MLSEVSGGKGGGLRGIGFGFRVSSGLRGTYEFDFVRDGLCQGFQASYEELSGSSRGQDGALGLGSLLIVVDPDSGLQ